MPDGFKICDETMERTNPLEMYNIHLSRSCEVTFSPRCVTPIHVRSSEPQAVSQRNFIIEQPELPQDDSRVLL